MNKLLHKGYTALLELRVDEGLIVGQIEGIPEEITFKSESIANIRKEFNKTVDDYLNSYTAINKTPPKPCSGNIQFRISPSLHAAALMIAKDENVSFNKFGEALIQNEVKKKFPYLGRMDRLDIQAT